jgi:hypothetical protein
MVHFFTKDDDRSIIPWEERNLVLFLGAGVSRDSGLMLGDETAGKLVDAAFDALGGGFSSEERNAKWPRLEVVVDYLEQYIDDAALWIVRSFAGLGLSSTGLKIQPISEGDSVESHAGFHFRGDMRQFADLLALQFSIPAAENPSEPSRACLASGSQIPVIDRTGLTGIFNINVDMHPELGTDMFTSWQRALQDQLGLKIEGRKENLEVLVVDSAARIPTAN